MGMAHNVWTTATRPVTNLVPGLLGFNVTTGGYEFWNGAAWTAMGGGGGGTPDVAVVALGWQDFQPDPDPGLGGAVNPAIDPTGAQYGWQLNPDRGFDAGILASIPIPTLVDVGRNPTVQVIVDDNGSGTGVFNYTVGLGIEDIPCGGGLPSGARGLYPGMLNLSPADTPNQTQCLVFVGAIPATIGTWHMSIRRYSATGGDTAPGVLNIVGATIEIPGLA